MKPFILILVCLFGLTAKPCLPSAFADANDYKLGVVIVVDQFRADYLMRFRDQFKGAYRTLTRDGAYFPLADHGLFQNMTGPGHAGILSGSYPYRNHIAINTWFDRELNQKQYCVQDDESKIIGSHGVVLDAKMGISPKNFNADTLGDELKNAKRTSQVVSISLKDRAAVLLGGKRSDYSLWFDEHHCEWVSSEFYLKELPSFAKKQNETLVQEKGKKYSWGPFENIEQCGHASLQTPWAMGETFQFALNAAETLKLGHGKDTDLLLLSLSSHDYLGHHFGPNDPAMEKMTLEEDARIGAFLNELAKKVPGGMKNIFVVLTGDHGMPPNTATHIPEDEYPKLVESELRKQYGIPKSGEAWVQAVTEFQIYLNSAALEAAKITAVEAVRAIRPRLLKEKYVDQVWARDEILIDRKVPAGEVGAILDRTLSFRSGDLITALKPFFYSGSDPFTHMTHYSYDRYVPLIFMGKTFKPGTYRQIVRIIDIAPTLASVLHVLPPAQSEGRVITEILR